MFEKTRDFLQKAAADARQAEREARGVFEEEFGDPLARETEWRPAAGGGTNVRSRVLKQPAPHRLSFKPTLQALLFPALLLTGGAAFWYYRPLNDVDPAWIQDVVGLVLVVVGLRWAYGMSKPVVLDTRLGFCWSGWRAPGSVEVARGRKDCAVLEDVRAVQVLRERAGGGDGDGGRSFNSYEINLVRADGSRLNLVDHGKLQVIRQDAEAVASLLEVPVWDASEMRLPL